MAPTLKRKNKFRDEYASIKGIKKSKMGDDYFHCDYCDDDLSLANMGKTAITTHLEKKKHKDNVKTATSNVSMVL